jgi:hypothetical protein
MGALLVITDFNPLLVVLISFDTCCLLELLFHVELCSGIWKKIFSKAANTGFCLLDG